MGNCVRTPLYKYTPWASRRLPNPQKDTSAEPHRVQRIPKQDSENLLSATPEGLDKAHLKVLQAPTNFTNPLVTFCEHWWYGSEVQPPRVYTYILDLRSIERAGPGQGKESVSCSLRVHTPVPEARDNMRCGCREPAGQPFEERLI